MQSSVSGRFHLIQKDGWTLIDDSYNANPSSFISALKNLKKMFPKNRKIVVCGAMAELGNSSNYLHEQVGMSMINFGVDKLISLGGAEVRSYLEGWKNAGGLDKDSLCFSELPELLNYFEICLRKDDVVLVKGSRSAKMDEFVKKVI